MPNDNEHDTPQDNEQEQEINEPEGDSGGDFANDVDDIYGCDSDDDGQDQEECS